MIDIIGRVQKLYLLDQNIIAHIRTEIDPLTGALSLRGFCEIAPELLQHLRRDEGAAVVYINIEDFKSYNARNGFEQGTEVLCRTADIIAAVFDDRLVSHVYGDRFIALVYESEVLDGIRELESRFMEHFPDAKLCLKFGICRVDSGKNVTFACDASKIACDSIRNKHGILFREYDLELEESVKKQRYIIANIDRAIAAGRIKVYYQPVIRTLTNEICGMEALARWDDDRYGLIRPDVLVSTLERYQQIHKLDACMIRQVCEEFEIRQKAGDRVVPVSFNLSRLDFELCDILQIIEDAVSRHHVPKNMVHIEITESVFDKNPEFIREQLHAFHKAGFEVWMDDFGSGFSSLNVLKEYDFDVIKIDMLFLRHFTTKARRILASIVDMAKKVGIRTLAEGVENADQLAFLRTIGCEKAQGFLIGKPEPLLVTRNNLEEKHYRFERLCLRQYYDDLGKVNFLSNQPLEYAAVSGRNLDVNQITDLDQGIPIAVWEMRGDIGRFLLTNRAYRDVLLSVGVQSPRAAEFDMNDREEQIYWSARQFFREMQEDGDIHAQYAVLGGHHCFIRGRVIARHHGRSAYLLVMQDLSGTFDIEQYKDQAEITNSLFRMFDYVFLLAERPDQDVLLYSVRELPTFSDMDDEGILHEVRKSLMVHPKDQDRYDDFFDRPAIHRALRDGDRAEMKGCFRFWDSSGSWCWKEISLSLSRVGDKKMLAGMRLQMLDMQSDISIGSFHPVSLKELQYLSQMKQTRDTNGHCL